MKYFEDMRDKYGFSDGEVVPPDAHASRQVYCQALNYLAAKFDSSCRIAEFDRPGMHNSCLLLLVEQSFYDEVYGRLLAESQVDVAEAQLYDHLHRQTAEVATDAGWQLALENAYDLELDQFVESQVRIDWDLLRKALAESRTPANSLLPQQEIPVTPFFAHFKQLLSPVDRSGPLSAPQLATVLAALRHWQEVTRQANLGAALLQYIPANLQFHFMEQGPLSRAEIDELCEQLNCDLSAVRVRQEPCECESPGYYCSGVPGILAHLQDGRLAPDAKVERCHLCRRYLSDEAALARLRELGLA